MRLGQQQHGNKQEEHHEERDSSSTCLVNAVSHQTCKGKQDELHKKESVAEEVHDGPRHHSALKLQ
eukprot:3493005-Amphidinium_carterae.1